MSDAEIRFYAKPLSTLLAELGTDQRGIVQGDGSEPNDPIVYGSTDDAGVTVYHMITAMSRKITSGGITEYLNETFKNLTAKGKLVTTLGLQSDGGTNLLPIGDENITNLTATTLRGMLQELSVSSGVSTYLGLSDTVDNEYTGKSNQIPFVNLSEDGLEFGNFIAGENISISNRVISSTGGTTAGQYSTVWLTADEIVLPSGTYYLTSTSKGVANGNQSINVNDNSKVFFPQDWFGGVTTDGATLYSGQYSLSLQVQSDTNGSDGRLYRFGVEFYVCDLDGNVEASGVTGQPIGDLGVQVLATGQSNAYDLTAGVAFNAQVIADLPEDFDLPANKRIRYHICGEKVGSEGGPVNLSVYFGTGGNSYLIQPRISTLSSVMQNGNTTEIPYEGILDNLLSTDRIMSFIKDGERLWSIFGNGKMLAQESDIASLRSGIKEVFNRFVSLGRSQFGGATDTGATISVVDQPNTTGELFIVPDFTYDGEGTYTLSSEVDLDFGLPCYEFTSGGGTTYYAYRGQVAGSFVYWFVGTVIRTGADSYNALCDYQSTNPVPAGAGVPSDADAYIGIQQPPNAAEFRNQSGTAPSISAETISATKIQAEDGSTVWNSMSEFFKQFYWQVLNTHYMELLPNEFNVHLDNAYRIRATGSYSGIESPDGSSHVRSFNGRNDITGDAVFTADVTMNAIPSGLPNGKTKAGNLAITTDRILYYE